MMKKLVALYPRAWRERYGEEFLALLDEQPMTPRVVVDLLRGALDAHLHPQKGGTVPRAASGVVPPAASSARANILMGAVLIHIEIALRLVALCDAGLRDYLRELSATAAPGPFLVPKFLCAVPAPAGDTPDGATARPPIVTTGARRPIVPTGPSSPKRGCRSVSTESRRSQ